MATFVNVKLHKHLPHDTTGEAQRIWKFVRRRLLVCQWSMATVFGVQVLRSAAMLHWYLRASRLLAPSLCRVQAAISWSAADLIQCLYPVRLSSRFLVTLLSMIHGCSIHDTLCCRRY